MRSVICFKDIKQAALYFDRVLPVAFKEMRGTGTDIVFDFPDHIPSKALIDIVFGHAIIEKENKYTLIGRVVDNWSEFAKQTRDYRSTLLDSRNDNYEDLHQAYLSNLSIESTGSIRTHFKRYAESLGIHTPDVLLPATSFGSDDAEDTIITLAGLNLIDVTRVNWDHIVELRQDYESQRKLQRLRAFLTQNYTGKSASYIEDDLGRLLDDYEQARRKHGFDTVTTSISILLEPSNIQALSACIGAILLGGVSVLEALSSAAAIEVSKVVIEVAKRRRQMVDWKSSHDLAYLIEVQDKMK